VGLQTVYAFIFLVVSMIVVIDVQYFFSSKIILKLSVSYHHARKKYLHSGERKAPHKYFLMWSFYWISATVYGCIYFYHKPLDSVAIYGMGGEFLSLHSGYML
jgi:hypothetical protein